MQEGALISCSYSANAFISNQFRKRAQWKYRIQKYSTDCNISACYRTSIAQTVAIHCCSVHLLVLQKMESSVHGNRIRHQNHLLDYNASAFSSLFPKGWKVFSQKYSHGLKFRSNHTSSKLKCFLHDSTDGIQGKSMEGDKFSMSCHGHGSCSEKTEMFNVKHECHADLNDHDLLLNHVDSAQACTRFSNLTEAPYDESIVARTEVGEVVPWWQQLPRRWTIVLLCFFAFLLCNMDRVNMSIAILPMSAEFGWDSATVGLVQSSFFWGYLLTQVAGGIWADRIGGKQVLGFGVIWWSLATMLTPLAAKVGLPVLLFVRACMGVGEGVAMPAMNNLLSKWVPVEERSRSLALVYSGMYLGSVTGLAFSPTLIHKYSWPSVFFSFGSIGALWFAAWQHYAHSSPAEDSKLSNEERSLIFRSVKVKKPASQIPWRQLLSKVPVWALIVCHFCHNWGTFILLTWMPTYYCQVLKLNLMESGMFSVLPWLTMALFANAGGWIADTLVSRGISITTVRKVMQTIGFLGPAFFLTQLSHITSPTQAVLCMMGSQGCDAFSQSGLYSNHQDIGPRYAGVLLGLSNTAGVLAGVLGTAATGYILQHGTWDDVFKVAVGLYLCGTVIWNLFSTGEQIID